MRTIGMLGGMSWESTVSYYQALNQGVKGALGGLHSAKVVLYSVDFQVIESLQQSGDWETAGQILAQAAAAVERAGAECLILCTNTMHKVAERIEQAVSIPLLHIADATARQLVADGVGRVGLLGTRFTMEQPFYRDRLQARYGIEVLVPESAEREQVHRIIYDELCQGQIKAASRECYLQIIQELQRAGAEAVILGCTEIALLVQQAHTPVPLYDTTAIHAARAVEFAIGD
ncbi:aspartate/glutamate racemase family protein [Sedimenticola sp.]|uniref:aspartate/glutamate racemase family protein n=1 Tax=Sedimenticola sp. TaxID=1940285 RepID=UPI003D11097C